jgi:Cft2 family RNA processing exonuclease
MMANWKQKTIPLETPTRIELKPGKEIQVTLFDANHCTGAVMFRKSFRCRFHLIHFNFRFERGIMDHLANS